MRRVRRGKGEMERGDGMTDNLSYLELKKIQQFVKAVIDREGNIYDALSAELDEAWKAFERWSAGMAKEDDGGGMIDG